jgi:hypothetical protein
MCVPERSPREMNRAPLSLMALSAASWSAFLKHLKERGLKGVWLITSDACIWACRKRRGILSS